MRRRLPTLDGWRAIAIVMVLIHHGNSSLYTDSALYFATAWTRHGANGVPIFFAISGFLITTLLADEWDVHQRIRLSAFYIRRAFRLLPVLVLFLLVLAVLGLNRDLGDIAASLMFYRNYTEGSPYTGHLWSLSVEEHFYLIWPVTLILLCRSRRPAVWAAALAVSVSMWRAADVRFGFVEHAFPFLAHGFRTDYRLDSLLWGGVGAYALRSHGLRPYVERGATALPWACAIAVYVCYVLIPGLRFGGLVLPALVVWLVLGTVISPHTVYARLLETPLMVWIGRRSYSLYVWQQMFLLAGWEAAGETFWQRAPWNFLLLVACASVSYRFVETPMIALGRGMVWRLDQARNRRAGLSAEAG